MFFSAGNHFAETMSAACTECENIMPALAQYKSVVELRLRGLHHNTRIPKIRRNHEHNSQVNCRGDRWTDGTRV